MRDPVERTDAAQRAARVALAAVLFGLGIWTILEFLPALAWAGILAIAVWPLYTLVRRRWAAGGHNVLLPALATAAVALLFIVPLALIGVQLGKEAHGTLLWLDEARRAGLPAPAWLVRLPHVGNTLAGWWQENLAHPADAGELLGRLGRERVLTMSRHFGEQVAHRVVLFGFTLLALFFLFRDGDRLTGQMLTAGRRAFGPSGERVGRQVVASVRGTVDGLVLVGLGEGVLLGIAYFVVGVPHPTLLGALTALAAMIPFGAPVVFGIAALLILANGGVMTAVGLFVFGLLVVFVADHAIRPGLIGSSTRLPFIWVLLGILGGVGTWGLLGLFLGPAIMAVLILLWREWTAEPTSAPLRSERDGDAVPPQTTTVR